MSKMTLSGLTNDAVAHVEAARRNVRLRSDGEQSNLAQFLTAWPTASFMAGLIGTVPKKLRLLDAGAGAGALTLATVIQLCSRHDRPEYVEAHLYEIDPHVAEALFQTVKRCEELLRSASIESKFIIHQQDFIEASSRRIASALFEAVEEFDLVIINPPYKKLSTDSVERKLLRSAGVEANNFYSAFVWLACLQLREGGQLVAITPRSFCNGPYFKAFRSYLDSSGAFNRVHIYNSRSKAFKEDAVLQENIIYSYLKIGTTRPEMVSITSSAGPEDVNVAEIELPYESFIRADDPDRVLHVVTDRLGMQILDQAKHFTATLNDLNLSISTGRVVDFRARDIIIEDGADTDIPLIYPAHFEHGYVAWPGRKARRTALRSTAKTVDLLVPNERFVLTKRFSSKEEKRRIVAAIYDPKFFEGSWVGFENHLNYFHIEGRGISEGIARGLCAFLNSSFVDQYFRLFNGHTQVNASDLKMIPLPTSEQLHQLATHVGERFHETDVVDTALHEMVGDETNPVQAMTKINEALLVLKAVGVDRDQQNDRSALTLLALLNLRPNSKWSDAEDPLRGVTEMMEFFDSEYGRKYAPNTRETVRRQTIHQFWQDGLIVANPDKPDRPVNSPYYVYRVTPEFLALVKEFGKDSWDERLLAYKRYQKAHKVRYNEDRSLNVIPVNLPDGSSLDLSPGGQNELIKEIIEQFGPRFTPGGSVFYVGDAGKKELCFDKAGFAELGLSFDMHGKMPDVVIYHRAKNWLLLIEAVTSHGPVDTKRRRELSQLFERSSAGPVYVTAFLKKSDMLRYLKDIAWETEVWNAEEPDHMIHFNGERFLGPYDK